MQSSLNATVGIRQGARVLVEVNNISSLNPADPGAALINYTNQKLEIDSRSIYVGNVDYATTPEELKEFFKGCGAVLRVSIQKNKGTKHPKGFAYVEFDTILTAKKSLRKNGTLFKNRNLKIQLKRSNVPGRKQRLTLPASKSRVGNAAPCPRITRDENGNLVTQGYLAKGNPCLSWKLNRNN